MNIGLHVKCYVTLGQGPTASGCGLNRVALFGYFAFLSAAGCGWPSLAPFNSPTVTWCNQLSLGNIRILKPLALSQ